MKAQIKTMTVPVIVSALLASLAPVPAASTVLPTTAIELHKSKRLVPSLTFNLENGQVFLPLSEATAYLQSLNEHKQRILSEAIAQRQAKGSGSLFSNTSQLIKLAQENIDHAVRIKEAIKIALSPEKLSLHYPDADDREEFRTELVKFGRAVATSEYTARDILSAITQSQPSEKVYHPDSLPAVEDVRAMITAEHKNLGLSAPEFL
ncbi:MULTISPECIES: hypothetical protein [Dickeya]|uniref:hypothetical protein n=1 Tax=Dickeya TaxID=204037 RepID=UPI0004889F8F|nr:MULTISPECIES: hypothetical protein [Dickeya]MBP2844091.1 iron-sulfur cluster assembly scaffold protein SufA [Dickeya oryzae]